jgi:hypothetical protein
MRSFCTSDEVPPLRHVLEWARAAGVELSLAGPPDADASDWDAAEIAYGSETQPVMLVEVNRAERDAVFADELDEFRESLEDAKVSPAKRSVLEQLDATRTIVAVQLLLGGGQGERALDAASTLLRFFVEHCGGMIQADGEGFYEGEQLLVQLE